MGYIFLVNSDTNVTPSWSATLTWWWGLMLQRPKGFFFKNLKQQSADQLSLKDTMHVTSANVIWF